MYLHIFRTFQLFPLSNSRSLLELEKPRPTIQLFSSRFSTDTFLLVSGTSKSPRILWISRSIDEDCSIFPHNDFSSPPIPFTRLRSLEPPHRSERRFTSSRLIPHDPRPLLGCGRTISSRISSPRSLSFRLDLFTSSLPSPLTVSSLDPISSRHSHLPLRRQCIDCVALEED